MRFHLKERAFRIKDDFVVRDEHDHEVFEIKDALFHVGDKLTMYDKASGQQILQIREHLFSQTKQYELFSADGAELATVERREHQLPYGGRYEVSTRDGLVLQIHGNFSEWDFSIVDHYGRLFGHISREFSLLGDLYTVDVPPGIDAPFVLALAVILDEVREDGDKD